MLPHDFTQFVLTEYQSTHDWLVTFKKLMPIDFSQYKEFHLYGETQYSYAFLMIAIQQKIDPDIFSTIVSHFYSLTPSLDDFFSHFFYCEDKISSKSFQDEEFDKEKLIFLSLNHKNKIVLNENNQPYLESLLYNCSNKEFECLCAGGFGDFISLFKNDFSPIHTILKTLFEEHSYGIAIVLAHLIKDEVKNKTKAYQSLLKIIPNLPSILQKEIFTTQPRYEFQKTLLTLYCNIVPSEQLIDAISHTYQQFFASHQIKDFDLFYLTSNINVYLYKELDQLPHVSCDLSQFDFNKDFSENLIYVMWMNYQISKGQHIDVSSELIQYCAKMIDENKEATYSLNTIFSDEFLSYIKHWQQVEISHQHFENNLPVNTVENMKKPKI